MKKVTTSGVQVIKFIPRQFSENLSVEIRDDSTNETNVLPFQVSIWNLADYNWEAANFNWETDNTAAIVGDYIQLSFEYDFVEGRFYDITVTDTADADLPIIYKDKLFCTDQTVNQETNEYYSVNEGEYVTYNSNDNDYIII